eukprot:10087-Chlamydomonas_euryale.AAC.1
MRARSLRMPGAGTQLAARVRGTAKGAVGQSALCTISGRSAALSPQPAVLNHRPNSCSFSARQARCLQLS